MKIEKYCLQCGEAQPDYTPADKLYCSDVCKQSAYRDRLAGPESADNPDEPEAAEEEGGLPGSFWLGAIGLGLGVWLFSSSTKTNNKAVTDRPNLPLTSGLDNLKLIK